MKVVSGGSDKSPTNPGCREVQREYRIGRLFAVIIWAELGDPARFSSSDNAVRYTGLDIAVYSSDGKRSGGG